MREDTGRILLPGHGSIGQSWPGCDGVLALTLVTASTARVDLADLAGEDTPFSRTTLCVSPDATCLVEEDNLLS